MAVRARGTGETSLVVRGLLDSGSQGCVVSSRLVDALGLPVRTRGSPVRGIGNLLVTAHPMEAYCTITPCEGDHPRFDVWAVVMDCILGRQPQARLSKGFLDLTRGVPVADPRFHIPGEVDVLLGADVLGSILTGGRRVFQQGGLAGLATIYGMSFMGPLRVPVSPEARDLAYGGLSLSSLVQRFWEIEEPPAASRVDPQAQECEAIFRDNTGRLADGRFITRLPFLQGRPVLGSSHGLAVKRLLAMERRMGRDPVFHAKYHDFMREYRDLGHMEVCQRDWGSMEHCFLPHHAVLKGPTAKIRVVFDGSVPTSTGVSLNQCLHAGPKLHRDVTDVLNRFRRHQVVFVADIRMMFRQTIIHPDDRQYQLIVWREDPRDPMEVFELKTNTYGLKSSPFVAIRSLLELASRERLNYPRASEVLEEDIYVDDICTGASSESEAMVLRDELVRLLQAGGYELRKWISNSPKLLADLPGDHKQDPLLFENPDNPDVTSVLGVSYGAVQDVFTYRTSLCEPKQWTKRQVLSTVARTFDPNGWIAPVLLAAKVFIQRLWKEELTWDEPITGELLKWWVWFFSSLHDVNRIVLPRRLLPAGKVRCTLHGFCDASERGYAASVYMRVIDGEENVSVRLVMAKTKVAPCRTALTIPKLELSGAALLVRLVNYVVSSLGRHIDFEEIYAWTDSQIVLCWLKTPVHNLEVFVANRVSQIRESVAPLIWRHIPGEMNPADCASRGCTATVLLDHELWWGPDWLKEPSVTWPAAALKPLDPLPGLRVGACIREPVGNSGFILERYSSLEKLIGVTGWIRRFIRNARNPKDRIMDRVLTPEERQGAYMHWIRVVQEMSFRDEISVLLAEKRQLKGSLVRLNPFVDNEGYLRVGGRLRNAKLAFGIRHPLLLPGGGHFVELLVRDRHVRNSHAGLVNLLGILQREVWILSARRVVRGIIFRCLPCYRLKTVTTQPYMGDLPSDRVNESRCFAGVGLDFGGPYTVKSSHLRGAKTYKAYLCVFVCLSTKAVHLEVVSSLSTESFIATLDRFVARRGLPALVRSDCGTNFRGANNYLRDVRDFLVREEQTIGHSLGVRGIRWEFSPPLCPSWGGIFEAAVKVAKTHLKKIIGESILSFEELSTLFCKIEATMNSRPLCPLSSDPNDLEVLTPGHFLIGQPMGALPERPYRGDSRGGLSRLQFVSQMAQHFWRRWSLEYLHLLQQRVKWTDKVRAPGVGDLVLLKEPHLPPTRWRRGRIVSLSYGTDGVPRVGEVRVGDAVLRRAVSSLARLPTD